VEGHVILELLYWDFVSGEDHSDIEIKTIVKRLIDTRLLPRPLPGEKVALAIYSRAAARSSRCSSRICSCCSFTAAMSSAVRLW